jgi:hypothetical protein
MMSTADTHSVDRLPMDVRLASRGSGGWGFAREVALPALAVVAIVAHADTRIPMGLPGHRGLVWLSLLVAVVLTAHRRATVIMVGAASTAATIAMHLPSGAAAAAAGSVRYVAAAILLYGVAVAPLALTRRWLVVLAAGPIHLVALVDSRFLAGGYRSALATPGMAEKVWFHLAFGVAAGLIGLAMASASTGAHRQAK